ncbi:MAG: hypothetical protein Q8N55_03530 [bacterium]|nr:hypothetical protein [bacterium]
MQSINQKIKEQERLEKTKQAAGLEREITQEQKAEENETFSPFEEGATKEKFQFQQPQNQTIDEEEENIEAQKKADNLRAETAEHKKIEQLLIIAQEKGADFAIKVAQKAKDPCLLDLFHDTLIQKGIKKAK